jgi:hypothetical protein
MGSVVGARHHLIIDPASTGDAAWGIIASEIRSFVDRVTDSFRLGI